MKKIKEAIEEFIYDVGYLIGACFQMGFEILENWVVLAILVILLLLFIYG